MQSTGKNVITVEGATYVIRVGGVNGFPSRTRETAWHVVAFACDPGWQNVSLAGPFETKQKAAEALELYLNQASYCSIACDEIIKAIRKP